MIEAIKKTLLAALKVVALSPEELRAILSEFEARGDLTEEQGKRILEALLSKGRKEKEEVSDRIGREFQRLAGRWPLVSRGEFRELSERVRRIEERLGASPGAPEEVPPAGEGR